MNTTLTKAGIGVLSAGAVGGASYGGYIYFSKDSFASKLGISVLNLTGTENSTVWNARLADLKAKEASLSEDLKALKDKEWTELQKWCNNNKGNKFGNKEDKTYQNFEAFCTWKIIDKAGSNMISSSTSNTEEAWRNAHKELKKISKDKLIPELQEIYDKAETENKDKEAMHKWCTDSYKKTWIGDNDVTLIAVKTYCKTS